jgi:hypothetical protein
MAFDDTKWSDDWSVSSSFAINIDTDVPMVPSPVNGSIIGTATPLINWEDIADAAGYHIQINHVSDFTGTIIADDRTLTVSDYTVDIDLEDSSTYYWRVKILNGVWSEWSNIWSFTIDITGPSTPEVSGTSLTNDTTPTWNWTIPNGSVDFRYQLDSEDSGGWIISDGTGVTSYTPGSTLSEESHTLYVQAQDSVGNWSASGSFPITIDITAPTIGAGTLTSPNGGEIWEEGSTQDIIWTSGDITDTNLGGIPISIEYSADSGTSWISIATGESNAGLYSWIVPSINSKTVRVKVIATDLAGNTSSDSSDSNFSSGWDETKLTASDGAQDDQFGRRVSISSDGNTVVSGAFRDDDNGDSSGSIYIYKWNGSSWAETKLTASDGAQDDWFGYSVSVSSDGNTVVSGAGGEDTRSGSIYIYKWNGSSWDETKLTASDGAQLDNFGYLVSLSSDSDTVVTGANGDDDNGDSSGSIYIYKWNGSSWAETKLTASDGAQGDQFGNGVSISSDGNTVVSGAGWDDNRSGSIYIYKWNGSSWAETKLTASDGASIDLFGYKVSISSDGNTVVSGASADDDNGENSGSIYIYKWNGSSWVETKLTASDGAQFDYFGYSVSVSSDGTTVVSGTYSDDDNGDNSGSIYIYKWKGSSWAETKLTASDGAQDDWFGYSVSVSSDGNTIVSGANEDDDNGSQSGSIYINIRY